MAEAVPVEALTAPALADVHAAGALVWRRRKRGLQVCLIHRPRYRDWSWPKGKLDPGESAAAAAAREVAEETGHHVVLGSALPGLRYRTPEGVTKHVRYWAARLADDEAALAARAAVTPAPSSEIDEVRWVPLAEAHELLTRPEDRIPLRALEHLAEEGRLDTRALVLLRHGRARSRSAWRKAEETRPLTGTGQAQAGALVPLLAAFGVGGVVSSPWLRCTATLSPYAAAAGLELVTVPELTEVAGTEHPAAATKLIRRLLRSGASTAVATHRPVLPILLGEVIEATRCWMVGSMPARDPYLRPGEALVLHVTGTGSATRVVAVETHRPPR